MLSEQKIAETKEEIFRSIQKEAQVKSSQRILSSAKAENQRMSLEIQQRSKRSKFFIGKKPVDSNAATSLNGSNSVVFSAASELAALETELS